MEPDINKIIDTLCSDLKPCKCLPNPIWRSVLWMVIAISYVAAVALVVGLQPNTMQRLGEHHFVFEIALSFITGVSASLVTFMLSVPDSRGKEWFYSVPITLFLVHMTWMVIRLVMEGFGNYPTHWFGHCWMDAVIMAGAPAALVLMLIKKGATVYPRLLAINAVLAVASFGWIGIRFTCPFETIGKAYFVNFLPYVVIGMILGISGKKLFRW